MHDKVNYVNFLMPFGGPFRRMLLWHAAVFNGW